MKRSLQRGPNFRMAYKEMFWDRGIWFYAKKKVLFLDLFV